MIYLYCNICQVPLEATIKIDNLNALFTLKQNKNTIKVHIQQFLAENPKIQIQTLFCPNCKKTIKEKEATSPCDIQEKLFPLDKLEYVGIQQPDRTSLRKITIEKNKYSDEKLLEKYELTPDSRVMWRTPITDIDWTIND